MNYMTQNIQVHEVSSGYGLNFTGVLCKSILLRTNIGATSPVKFVIATMVSMEVSNQLVSWLIAYLGDLQPTYIGVIIHLDVSKNMGTPKWMVYL